MSDRAIELLNDSLKIFNTSSGEYLKFVGDSTKTTPVIDGEVKINDINTGAISNVLEYTRKFNNFLVEQLDLRTTKDTWLDYVGENIYDITRLAGETDDNYFQRIINMVIEIKCTVPMIKKAMDDYGSGVQVLEDDDGAFADVSFADYYRNIPNKGQGVIKAALAGLYRGMPFFFRVIIFGVDEENYSVIPIILSAHKAAGINYLVQLE